jgi:hypothetical protein
MRGLMKESKCCLHPIILTVLFLFPIISSAHDIDSQELNERESGPTQDILNLYQKNAGDLSLDEDGDSWNVELVSQLYSTGGGVNQWEANSVAISGNFAYVLGSESGLWILDITNPTNPNNVGLCEIEGDGQDVAVLNDYAYVPCGDDGMRIISVVDPSNPVEVAFFQSSESARRVSVFDDYALLVDGDYLKIINISDPTNPELAGSFDSEVSIMDLVVVDNYAYLAADSDGLKIIDISDPANPFMIGSLATDDMSWGIAIQDNYAFVADMFGTSIIDISDPANPFRVSFINGVINGAPEVLDVTVSGDILYALVETGSLQIINIVDPSNPNVVGTYEGSIGIFLNMALTGNYVYISDYDSGLVIIDVSDPTDPSIIPNSNAEVLARGVVVLEDYAYLADEYSGLRIIDISDPINTNEIGLFTCWPRPNDVDIQGDYAYLASGTGGLTIVDISDPTDPELSGSSLHSWNDDFRGIDVIGEYAYLTDVRTSGLRIFDISDPANPELITSYSLDGLPTNVSVSGDYAYVSGFEMGLIIIDISDPENPNQINELPINLRGISISGDFAYLACSLEGLIIVDVSDPVDPFEVGSYNTSGDAVNVTISGDYAYLSDSEAGVRVLDISDPENPVEMGYYDTDSSTLDIKISGDYAYLADNEYFKVLDCSQIGTITTPAPFSLISPLNNTTVGCNEVELRWTESSYDVCEYVFWYSMDSEFSVGLDSMIIDINTCTLNNLEDQSTYWWKVRANNETSLGTWSNNTLSFNTDISVSVDDDVNSDFPTEYAITNTYPNPFNPTLNVSIALPETSKLKVSVYNVMGQSVATVADRSYTAGTHNFTFNGSDLSSGVYFIHASVAGKLNHVKKVVLMK